MIYIVLVILAVLIGWQAWEFWVAVGRQPRGERLERCKQSPQWKDGEFVNVHETPTLTGDEGFFGQMYKFLFMDWKTVTALRDRVGQVVCSLGIGEHFEYWGYDPKKIHDLDWGESYGPLRCLPTRHFSGRMGQHKTLWASYLIEGPRRIFVSGDGGYDERFKQIGEQYPDIDLAIMENGQYDKGWRYIHTLPRELPQAISDLGAARVLTYHNSKYSLANHSWTEPLDSIYEHAKGQPWQLLTPRIGEPIGLDEQQTSRKWW